MPHERKEMTLLGEASGGLMNIPIEQLGTPGALTTLHLTPAEASDDQVFRDDTERQFEVSARLSKVPAMITEHIKLESAIKMAVATSRLTERKYVSKPHKAI